MQLVDIDVHSGNGSQAVILRTIVRLSRGNAADKAMAEQLQANIRFFNAFQNSERHGYFPYAGGYKASVDRRQADAAKAVIHNVPYKPGTSGAAVCKALKAYQSDLRNESFKPDLTIFSYGMDAHARDSMSSARFTQQHYYDLALAVPGKCVFLPEGGYNKAGIEQAMAAAASACHKKSSQHLQAKTSAAAVVALGQHTRQNKADAGVSSAAVTTDDASFKSAI